MSLQLSVSLSAASVNSGEIVSVILTLTNSGLDPVIVSEIRPNAQGLQQTAGVFKDMGLHIPPSASIVVSYGVRAFLDNQSISVRVYTVDGQSISDSASLIVT